jgi:PHD/YefM family antitoxin component YafN of YafNO toxin-antitoxin module
MTQQTLKTMHDDLSEALGLVQENGPVVLEYEGKPVAALISMDELRILEARIEAIEDRIDREEIEKALAEPSAPVPYETFRKELGLA